MTWGESSKSAHADTWEHNQVLVAELPLCFLSLAFARELQRHTALAASIAPAVQNCSLMTFCAFLLKVNKLCKSKVAATGAYIWLLGDGELVQALTIYCLPF